MTEKLRQLLLFVELPDEETCERLKQQLLDLLSSTRWCTDAQIRRKAEKRHNIDSFLTRHFLQELHLKGDVQRQTGTRGAVSWRKVQR